MKFLVASLSSKLDKNLIEKNLIDLLRGTLNFEQEYQDFVSNKKQRRANLFPLHNVLSDNISKVCSSSFVKFKTD